VEKDVIDDMKDPQIAALRIKQLEASTKSMLEEVHEELTRMNEQQREKKMEMDFQLEAEKRNFETTKSKLMTPVELEKLKFRDAELTRQMNEQADKKNKLRDVRFLRLPKPIWNGDQVLWTLCQEFDMDQSQDIIISVFLLYDHFHVDNTYYY